MLSPSTLDDILSQRDELEALIDSQRHNIGSQRNDASITKVQSKANSNPQFKEIKSQLTLILKVCQERIARLDQNQHHNNNDQDDNITPLSQEYLDSGSFCNTNDSNGSWNFHGATSTGGIDDSFERDRTINDTYEALTRSGNHMSIVLDNLNGEYHDRLNGYPPKIAQSFGNILESLAGLADNVPPTSQPELQDLALLMRVTMHEFSH
ncbi:uncharacterized protein KQ657_002373 [Scheffersomyces spartinae]|uniref:Uncharacterized protein n=1 Tax=Scheffersomyces spartinae TaxID=45513 RepID=A0A9P7VEX3_9ASCO|nr:uncharacterized protein KQ657_002373 [Scheffersomyces spartinae]KAG7195986.1 hypothetical protein KQ657_002373 [Scheffersomyces spartinae]